MVIEFVNAVASARCPERHLARGLAYAHPEPDLTGRPLGIGIVHRDGGPEKIMLAYKDDVKLTDLGIA